MARKNSSLLGDILFGLILCPWWLSVVIAAGVYFLLNNVLPAMKFEGLLLPGIAKAAPQLAPFFGLLFLLPAPLSLINSIRKTNILKKQDGLASIRALSWKEFEELVAEVFRKQGYKVTENDTMGPDGGVDLVLRKEENVYLVQCKRWLNASVGVNVVREMFGLMHANNAYGVIIVTTGFFTQEARNFAEGKSIDLIEGSELVKLVKSSQNILSAFSSGTLDFIITKLNRYGFSSILKPLLIAVSISFVSILLILFWHPSLSPEIANSNIIQNIFKFFPSQKRDEPPVIEKAEPSTKAKDYVFSEQEISIAKEKLLKEKQANALFEIQLNSGRTLFAKNVTINGEILSFENDNGLVVSMNRQDVNKVRKVIQR